MVYDTCRLCLRVAVTRDTYERHYPLKMGNHLMGGAESKGQIQRYPDGHPWDRPPSGKDLDRGDTWGRAEPRHRHGNGFSIGHGPKPKIKAQSGRGRRTGLQTWPREPGNDTKHLLTALCPDLRPLAFERHHQDHTNQVIPLGTCLQISKLKPFQKKQKPGKNI